MPVGRAGFFKLVSQLGFGLKSAVGAATLAALLSACQGPNSNYFQNGVGSQLPVADTAQAARLQDQYFQYLCQQAGLVADPAQRCPLPLVDSRIWTLIVLQGMNDIDRRCDAYLEWLDNRKRSKGPLLAQSNAIATTATAIIQIVSPGSVAISIVAQAFGLLNQSIENYHSRLLLEVESSTINSVVLNARYDFRKALRETNVTFINRPDAEYALREYLRRCLPFAIETQINDLSTLGSRGIEARDNSIFQAPVLLGAQLQSDLPSSSEGEIHKTKPPMTGGGRGPTPFDPMSIGAIEQRYSKQGVQGIQRKLCVPETGQYDKTTRAAIAVAEQEIQSGRKNGIIDTRGEEDAILDEPDGCSSLAYQFANTFEKFRFRAGTPEAIKASIRDFQTGLYSCVAQLEQAFGQQLPEKPSEDVFKSGVFNDSTRNAIRFVEVEGKVAEMPRSSGKLSATLLDKITSCSFD